MDVSFGPVPPLAVFKKGSYFHSPFYLMQSAVTIKGILNCSINPGFEFSRTCFYTMPGDTNQYTVQKPLLQFTTVQIIFSFHFLGDMPVCFLKNLLKAATEA